MKYVLDTHALIWFLEGNLKLGANAKTILSDSDSELVIPATTLAEAVWIVERGRTDYEDRWITIGLDETGILRVVIHTFEQTDEDSCLIRIISARKATFNEQQYYQGRKL
ncbi:BrnT family toxin [Anabaena sp. UHCC 0204]|uniref:BrnT family toxin n=1 Tax=Anabaena sp. UHCC 0204 TaxID=2590009 RepID=UPI00144703B5|nr:BrnT family toxin [Anabaena sp. UHCC 0204]MTJ10622.1 PIN domain-containing protein [Anabaena sp. UHCC 0204]